MSLDAEKIVVPFTLLPENKQKIQSYMEQHWDELRSSDAAAVKVAHQGLKDVLIENLPKESITALGDILSGKSDQGLLIHNLPERKEYEMQHIPPHPHEVYSYHIGKALYELQGARLIKTAGGARQSHIPEKRKSWNFNQLTIHRDGIQAATTPEDMSTFGDYIIFSCPYNGEHAPTEIIQLKRALETLPENVREKVIVQTSDRIGDSGTEYEPFGPVNLNQLLLMLKKFDTQHAYYFVKEVSLACDPNMPEAKQFIDAVSKHSVKNVLHNGDLLLINENSMFHCAGEGDNAMIEKIPPTQPHSRVLMHYAGTGKKAGAEVSFVGH